MKHHAHFERAVQAVAREAVKIRTLIAHLDRTIQILDCDIADGAERAQVLDRSDPAYPTLARTLGARRENLADSIAALERRLATIDELAAQVA